ncbi:MAG: hypothetical protein ACYC0V_00285 [Armatimonadota bacterium]
MNAIPGIPITEEIVIPVAPKITKEDPFEKMAISSSDYQAEIDGGIIYFSIERSPRSGDISLNAWADMRYFRQQLTVFTGEQGDDQISTYIRTRPGFDDKGNLVGKAVGRYITIAKAVMSFRAFAGNSNSEAKPVTYAATYIDFGAIGDALAGKFRTRDFTRINHDAWGIPRETEEEREARIAQAQANYESSAESTEEQPVEASTAWDDIE